MIKEGGDALMAAVSFRMMLTRRWRLERLSPCLPTWTWTGLGASTNTAGRASRAQTPLQNDMVSQGFLWQRTQTFSGAAAAAAKKSGGKQQKKKKKGMQFKRRRVQVYAIDEVLRLVQAQATARFDETVDISLQLGVDPRKSHENVRGVVNLPYGTGKSVRVAVFARGDAAEAARQAGADIVGSDELVESIQKGELNFDKAIATPDMMQLVGKVARILGPRGMMPNPKLGTVTQDTATAVNNAKAGQIQFRNEKQGILHAPLGKASWESWKVKANLRALMLALQASKPDTLKGIFFRKATISTTQGRGIHVEMATIDPGKSRFMIKTEPLGDKAPVLGTENNEEGNNMCAPSS